MKAEKRLLIKHKKNVEIVKKAISMLGDLINISAKELSDFFKSKTSLTRGGGAFFDVSFLTFEEFELALEELVNSGLLTRRFEVEFHNQNNEAVFIHFDNYYISSKEYAEYQENPVVIHQRTGRTFAEKELREFGNIYATCTAKYSVAVVFDADLYSEDRFNDALGVINLASQRGLKRLNEGELTDNEATEIFKKILLYADYINKAHAHLTKKP